MQHIYHWKHGWIPLDHIAALSKAKGNHKAAAKMLGDVAHSPGIDSRRALAGAILHAKDVHEKDRPGVVKDLVEHAKQLKATDLLPASWRPKTASNRDRLRSDMKTAQHAQNLRAEEYGKGYKSETASFFGSSKHSTASTSESKLTQSQADREASAQAAADREEARAYAERQKALKVKAGQISDDLNHLDGVHKPDDTAATQDALEAKTLASVRAKGMKQADVDATLQAAMRLPESPQQQALVAALATHLNELKAKADAYPVKAAEKVNAEAGARHAANKAAAESDVKRTNVAEALRNGNANISTPGLVNLAGSDHPQAPRAQAELDRRAVEQVAARITSQADREAALKRAQAMPEGPLKAATIRALNPSWKSPSAAPMTVAGVDEFGHRTSFTGHVAATGDVTIGGKPHKVYQMHNGSPDGGGIDATARTAVYVPNPGGPTRPASASAPEHTGPKTGDTVQVKVGGSNRVGTVTASSNGRATVNVPGHGPVHRDHADVSTTIHPATAAAEARRSGVPDYSKTPLARLKAAIDSPGFDAAHKDAMRAELRRRISATPSRSAELRAQADAQRAKADAAFEGASTGDRAAGSLNAGNLARQGARNDSALRRYTAATEAAQRLEGKAQMAESRAKEAARVRLTHDDLKGAGLVRDRSGWHQVVRVNAKTVTVKTPYSWTDTIAHDKILEARKKPTA